jgi:hypothetical protein
MADAADSKSAVRKGVWVRIPPRAPPLSSKDALPSCILRGREWAPWSQNGHGSFAESVSWPQFRSARRPRNVTASGRPPHPDDDKVALPCVEIAASARRHGIADEDMRHALRNPILVLDVDELVMVIGADRSGRLLEVGVRDGDRIVHAMYAREKFLR